MPTDLEQIEQIRLQTLAILAEITAAPKPSYAIDGQQVAWADYLTRLQQTVEWCEKRLALSDPVEFASIGCT